MIDKIFFDTEYVEDVAAVRQLLSFLWHGDLLDVVRNVIKEFLPDPGESMYFDVDKLNVFEENLRKIIVLRFPEIGNSLEALFVGDECRDDKLRREKLVQLRWIFGWALAELFLEAEQCGLNGICILIFEWRTFAGVEAAFHYYFDKDVGRSMSSGDCCIPNNLAEINDIPAESRFDKFKTNVSEVLMPFASKPEMFISDRSRYGKDLKFKITEWRSLSRHDFSLFWENTFHGSLEFTSPYVLMLNYVLEFDKCLFVKLASCFKIPGQIDQVLYGEQLSRDTGIIFKILEISPSVIDAPGEEWNGEILVLEVVNVVRHLLEMNVNNLLP